MSDHWFANNNNSPSSTSPRASNGASAAARGSPEVPSDGSSVFSLLSPRPFSGVSTRQQEYRSVLSAAANSVSTGTWSGQRPSSYHQSQTSPKPSVAPHNRYSDIFDQAYISPPTTDAMLHQQGAERIVPIRVEHVPASPGMAAPAPGSFPSPQSPRWLVDAGFTPWITPEEVAQLKSSFEPEFMNNFMTSPTSNQENQQNQEMQPQEAFQPVYSSVRTRSAVSGVARYQAAPAYMENTAQDPCPSPATPTRPSIPPKPTHLTAAAKPVTVQYTQPAVEQQEEAPTEVPMIVREFDEVNAGAFADFLKLSVSIGGDVQEIANLVKSAFDAERQFLIAAAGQPKPDDAIRASLLRPISEKIEAVQQYREAHRTSTCFTHLSAISESIGALGWVAVSPTPAPYIKEMADASQFYTNRVLKDYKDKDQIHVDWARAWLRTLTELQQYVKQHHTTGVVWNSAPGSAPPRVSSGAVPPAPTMQAPLPPPPPPPPGILDLNGSVPSDADGRAALFAELNRGEDVTRGLKKVTADMQTHKNPALRGTEPVPATAPKPSGGSQQVTASPKKDLPPVLELQGGKKWVVENFKGKRDLIIQVENIKQAVYVYKCDDCVVQVKGKANTITMDTCKKTAIVFDSVVSSVELINCQSAQVQSMGALPTVSVDKTDGCQVYLSQESAGAELVTSKCSSVNLLVPDASGEFVEHPVPEQFKTICKAGKLHTIAVEMG